MITKEQLLDSCRHETNVIKHLATRLPEGKLDWRPTPNQRSMIELMRYMSAMSLIPAVYCVTGNWDHAADLGKESGSVTPDNFADAMDRQMTRIAEVLGKVDEQAATTAPAAMPWGAPIAQSACMMDTILKSFVAYRMQFFLYCKQAGSTDLATYDCWAGEPPPPSS